MDGKAPNLRLATDMALQCMKDGRAMETLNKLIEFSRQDDESVQQ